MVKPFEDAVSSLLAESEITGIVLDMSKVVLLDSATLELLLEFDPDLAALTQLLEWLDQGKLVERQVQRWPRQGCSAMKPKSFLAAPAIVFGTIPKLTEALTPKKNARS